MLVYRYNPPGGKPAGETLAVAMAQSWKGPYRLIADNLTNTPVSPGRFLQDARNGTVWFTQNAGNSGGYSGSKWRVDCAAPCAGSQPWSGTAACGLAAIAAAAELARLQTMPANFTCDQAANGETAQRGYIIMTCGARYMTINVRCFAETFLSSQATTVPRTRGSSKMLTAIISCFINTTNRIQSPAATCTRLTASTGQARPKLSTMS